MGPGGAGGLLAGALASGAGGGPWWGAGLPEASPRTLLLAAVATLAAVFLSRVPSTTCAITQLPPGQGHPPAPPRAAACGGPACGAGRGAGRGGAGRPGPPAPSGRRPPAAAAPGRCGAPAPPPGWGIRTDGREGLPAVAARPGGLGRRGERLGGPARARGGGPRTF